ncbi:hypothetical protein [Pontibacter mangrovi]|uniref:DUF5666 domain-containing protein n=1 Tax=Pontibacter mangrovi TaxID=2589816 RepID=A0A501W100_9BACT|nr:hypothetical protein [Pontibacter mangrovi]TPE42958.1 hypothetical protein FJM65_15010 [Pontibacter mangrovi]
MKQLNSILAIGILACSLLLGGCQRNATSSTNTDTESAAYKSLAPQRVDIRGSVVSRHYNQGQVMLEVEAFGSSPDSRYDRAYVLVLPTAQLTGTDGRSISLNELQMGQQVAILLRGGGRGNFVGIGVARKLWVEERY